MYSGKIHALGPRYCPSVEDKTKKFPDVKSHPLFLEPEGTNTEEFYIQGFSTSMPEEVQRALFKIRARAGKRFHYAAGLCY